MHSKIGVFWGPDMREISEVLLYIFKKNVIPYLYSVINITTRKFLVVVFLTVHY